MQSAGNRGSAKSGKSMDRNEAQPTEPQPSSYHPPPDDSVGNSDPSSRPASQPGQPGSTAERELDQTGGENDLPDATAEPPLIAPDADDENPNPSRPTSGAASQPQSRSQSRHDTPTNQPRPASQQQDGIDQSNFSEDNDSQSTSSQLNVSKSRLTDDGQVVNGGVKGEDANDDGGSVVSGFSGMKEDVDGDNDKSDAGDIAQN
jgi:hypothetical protein